MQRHFAGIASVYREVRTTDPAPVRLIAERLRGLEGIRGADIGCGSGRYDLLLFEHIPGLRLTCVDVNQEMLDEAARYLGEHGVVDFDTVRSSIADLALTAGSFDCVFTFNAIHHFDVATFLAKAKAALKAGGHVFIYTRTPEQNARSIWGRYFPDFAEKETRLYPLARMRRWIEEADGLRLEQATPCRYPRRASLDRLLNQARSKHYSTLSLYSAAAFDEALETFEGNLRRDFDDLERIAWDDENLLLGIRRSEG